MCCAGTFVPNLATRPHIEGMHMFTAHNTAAGCERHALVIEDCMMLQCLMQKVLSGMGFIPHEAHSIQDAEDAVRTKAFDLLIVDGHLGTESSFEFVRGFRRCNVETPIVMWSADDSADMQLLSAAAGCDCFISKTTAPNGTVHALQTVLRESQQLALAAMQSSDAT